MILKEFISNLQDFSQAGYDESDVFIRTDSVFPSLVMGVGIADKAIILKASEDGKTISEPEAS
jgi:hypothetical protein